MDPVAAKAVAATSGATLTALTMTPFDVVKTRLQTQPRPSSSALSSRLPSSQTCCLPSNMPCVRNMSSLAAGRTLRTFAASAGNATPAELVSAEFICLWDRVGGVRTERVNGFADAVRKVWRAEGLKGLWKGVGTTLVIAVPSQTAYMLTYDHLLNNLLPTISPTPTLTPLLSGVLARTIVSSLASPLELLRTNLQATPISAANPNTLRGVLRATSVLVQSQGVRALWRGLGPTLWRDVPFSGVYWASYESWKRFFHENGFRGAGAAFLSGTISGSTAAVLTQPFDVVKTRQQAVLMGSASPLQSLRGGLRTTTTTAGSSSLSLALRIIKNEGGKALFTGLTPRMAKIAPACGIMISSYEGVGRLLAAPRTEDD